MSINLDTRVNLTSALGGLDDGSLGINKSKSLRINIPDVKPQEGAAQFGLPQPCKSIADVDMSAFVGIPSPGADMMALLSELSDDQRRANREQIMASTQVAVETIKDQAQMMRDQAVTNLVMGLVSSMIEIGTSAASAIGSAKALKSTSVIADSALRAGVLQAETMKVQGTTQAVGGLAKVVSAAKDYVSAQTDASIKEKDAELEMARALRSQLESLNDSFKEDITKARETHQEIQQSTNQTRARILG